MSKNYKLQSHGKKRFLKKKITLAGTGTQTASISLKDATMFQIATNASASTALTLDVTDLFDGAVFHIDYNALHGSDTLTITFNGTADLTSRDGTGTDKSNITVSDRNFLEGFVVDSTDGSEVGIIRWNIN